MKLIFEHFRDIFSPWLSSDYPLKENPTKFGAQLTCMGTFVLKQLIVHCVSRLAAHRDKKYTTYSLITYNTFVPYTLV